MLNFAVHEFEAHATYAYSASSLRGGSTAMHSVPFHALVGHNFHLDVSKIMTSSKSTPQEACNYRSSTSKLDCGAILFLYGQSTFQLSAQ